MNTERDAREKDLTVVEVAEELSLNTDTIKRLLRQGLLPGYKAGLKQWRVTREALDAFKASGGAKRPGRPKKEDDQKESEGN